MKIHLAKLLGFIKQEAKTMKGKIITILAVELVWRISIINKVILNIKKLIKYKK